MRSSGLLDIDNAHTKAAYAIFTATHLLDQQINNPNPLYLVFEEAGRFKKAKQLLERIFGESRKFGVGAIFIEQLDSEVPKFVTDNAATHINFNSTFSNAKKSANNQKNSALNRYQAAITQRNGTTVINTRAFCPSNSLGLPNGQYAQLGQAEPNTISASFNKLKQLFS